MMSVWLSVGSFQVYFCCEQSKYLSDALLQPCLTGTWAGHLKAAGCSACKPSLLNEWIHKTSIVIWDHWVLHIFIVTESNSPRVRVWVRLHQSSTVFFSVLSHFYLRVWNFIFSRSILYISISIQKTWKHISYLQWLSCYKHTLQAYSLNLPVFQSFQALNLTHFHASLILFSLRSMLLSPWLWTSLLAQSRPGWAWFWICPWGFLACLRRWRTSGSCWATAPTLTCRLRRRTMASFNCYMVNPCDLTGSYCDAIHFQKTKSTQYLVV